MSAVLAHEIHQPARVAEGRAQLTARGSCCRPGREVARQSTASTGQAVRLEKLTRDLLAFVRTGQLSACAGAAAHSRPRCRATIDPAIEIDDVGRRRRCGPSTPARLRRGAGESPRQRGRSRAAGADARERADSIRLVFEDHRPRRRRAARQTRETRSSGRSSPARRAAPASGSRSPSAWSSSIGGKITIDDAPGSGSSHRDRYMTWHTSSSPTTNQACANSWPTRSNSTRTSACTAPDGRVAAKLLDERGFDLVITDLKMPGLDGMACSARCRPSSPRSR